MKITNLTLVLDTVIKGDAQLGGGELKSELI